MYYTLLDKLNISVLQNLSISQNIWIILNQSLFWNLGGGGDQTCTLILQCRSNRSLQARWESLEAYQKRRSLMTKRRRTRSKRRRMMRIRRRMRCRGRGGMRRTCMTAWWSGWSKSIWSVKMEFSPSHGSHLVPFSQSLVEERGQVFTEISLKWKLISWVLKLGGWIPLEVDEPISYNKRKNLKEKGEKTNKNTNIIVKLEKL